MKNYSPFQGIIELHGERTVRLIPNSGKFYILESLRGDVWLYEGCFFSRARSNKALYQDALNFLEYGNALNPRY